MAYFDHENPRAGLTILEHLLIEKAKEYLKEVVLEGMDYAIEQTAIEAVREFGKVHIQKDTNPMGTEVNYHVEFIKKVVKTIEVDNPKIFVKGAKDE